MSDYNSLNSSFNIGLNESQSIDSFYPFSGFDKDNQESDQNTFINNFFEERLTKEMTNDDMTKKSKKKKVYKKEYKNDILVDNLFIDISQDSNLNNSLSDTKEKKMLGRKRKNESDDKAKHNRFQDDNSRRKVKRIIISEVQDFINEKIEEKYDGDIGEGMNKKN